MAVDPTTAGETVDYRARWCSLHPDVQDRLLASLDPEERVQLVILLAHPSPLEDRIRELLADGVPRSEWEIAKRLHVARSRVKRILETSRQFTACPLEQACAQHRRARLWRLAPSDSPTERELLCT